MKRGALLLFIALTGCGGPMETASFSSLLDYQPAVLSVSPSDGAADYESNQVAVAFSQPVDSKSVTAKSFLVVTVPEGEIDRTALWNDVKKERVRGVKGNYEIDSDKKNVRFIAKENFEPGVRCGVLLTPDILSEAQVPLNQTPGSGPTPFFSTFYAKGGTVAGGVGALQEGAEGVGGTGANTARPSHLYLSEIFYDAVGVDTEGDLFIELYGEAGGDLSDYQIIMVNGADGKVTSSVKIPKGMQVGEDGLFVVADAVTNQPGITKVIGADYVATLDPANGPDCIQLVDPSGQLVDVIGYGTPLVLRAANNLLCYSGTPALDAPNGTSLARKILR
ncbi:MAG: Ig-like domain-containing protein, partial [bacterium]|nr:Ig-like domain-containing protein [bacterium]